MLGVNFCLLQSERDSRLYRAGTPTPGSTQAIFLAFNCLQQKKISAPEFLWRTTNNSLLVLGTIFCFFIIFRAQSIHFFVTCQSMMNGNQGQQVPQPQQPLQQQPCWVNARNHQYTSAEVFGLLNCIQQVLLVDSTDWIDVCNLHVVNFLNTGHDPSKLKQKFQQLYRTNVPTGDPICPPDVRMAKRLQEAIRKKSEIDDGEAPIIFEALVEEGQHVVGNNRAQIEQDHDQVPEQSDADSVDAEIHNNLQPAVNNNNGNAIATTNNITRVVTNNVPAAVVARQNTVSPVPPIAAHNISQIVATRRLQQKKSTVDDLIDIYKLKFLQHEEENNAKQQPWEREHADKQAQMDAELQRMHVEAEIHHEEEAHHYAREAEEHRNEATA